MRQSTRDVEAPVFYASANGPCYVPDRDGNDAYVAAADAEYDFGAPR
jgi:hypothetical protein